VNRKEMQSTSGLGDASRHPDLRARILRLLDEAVWHYDEESDELEIALPASDGREGLAFPVDDFYVRVDPDSFEPLSIIVPGYRAWVAEQPPVVEDDRPESWTGIASRTAAAAIRRTLRESGDLATGSVWAAS
jgi:hypothetical protein